MKHIAIIVAGGSGTRMGTEVPKQFMPLGGLPILAWSLQAFHRYDAQAEIIIALPEAFMEYWQQLQAQYHIQIPHRVVAGGAERFFSVKNALDSLPPQEALVAIHDAARPFITIEYIGRLYSHAAEHGSALPALPLKDSIRKKDDSGWRPADRSLFRIIQTPQVFRLLSLNEAYKQPYTAAFTDDASVMEAAGYTVSLADGLEEAFKITTPFDLSLAQMLAAQGPDKLK